MKFRRPLLRALPVLLALPAFSAWSQQLEEITVTASRMEESINRVPLSITAFTDAQLEQQRVLRVDDIGRLTPGLQFRKTSASTTQISIRGIQSNIGAGTTGIYIDDTPIQTRKAGLSFTATNAYPEIFDIDRIEVLRGPQGTLFGSGSMGGAVRFITTQPDLNKFSLRVRGETSFTDNGDPSVEAGFAAGGPLVENKSAFRFSARFRRDGGFVDRQSRSDLVDALNSPGAVTSGRDSNANWQDNASLRLALTFAVNDNLHITPSFFFQRTKANATGEYWDYFSRPSDGSYVSGDGVPSRFTDRWSLPALNVRYDAGPVAVISNTSYLDRKSYSYYDCTTCIIQLTALGPQLLTPLQFLPTYPDFAEQAYDKNQQKVFTQEIRAQSADSNARLRWVAGLFFQHSKTQAEDFVPLDAATFTRFSQAMGQTQNPPINFASYQDLFYGASLIDGIQTYQTYDQLVEKQYAGFTELSFELTPGLRLAGGVRISRNKLDATSLQGGPFAGTNELVGFSADQSETSTTPKGTLSWQVNDANLLYATVAKGFRGGGVNQPLPSACDQAALNAGLSGAPQQFKSDKLISYEIGAKNRLFDSRLSVAASIFYIDWKDIQQSLYLGQGCNRSLTLNANSATSRGFDLQASVALTEQWTLSASAAYTKATYDEPLTGSPDPSTGVRPILINKGNTLDGVVPWSGTFALDYGTQWRGHEVFARADYQFSSRQRDPTQTQDPATVTFLPYSRFLPQIDRLNLRTGARFGETEVSLFVDNLLNSHPSIQTSAGDAFNSATRSYTIRPRTIGVSVNVRL